MQLIGLAELNTSAAYGLQQYNVEKTKFAILVPVPVCTVAQA